MAATTMKKTLISPMKTTNKREPILTVMMILVRAPKRSARGRLRAGLLFGLMLLIPLNGTIVRTAGAQNRGPVQRIVTGKVADKAGQPVKNAVVYLKDDKTLSVKSFISDDNGGYRFGQLSQNTDYELWAETEGRKSATKTISSFDSKSDITINLKMDK